ncbi:MAG TPA: S41 family peptidase [Candidatus Sulfotelmatobacter sp.]|nr:S41 family peptidase [Candidatus Sulfotelmatobacter sp.]
MLRQLFIFALRLHPPAFRARFEDEMLSIYDHTVGARNRFALLVDIVFSVSRQWALRSEFWLESPSLSQPAGSEGIPSFYTLDRFHPKAAALVHGLLLSSVLFALTCFAIKYSWIHLLHVRIPEVQFSAFQPVATDSPRDPGPQASIPAKTSPAPPHSDPQRNLLGENAGQPSGAKSATTSAAIGPASQAVPQAPATAIARQSVPEGTLGVVERKLIVRAAAQQLTRSYVDRNTGQRIASALLSHDQNGDYDKITDDASFARVLTSQMQQVSHDRHLNMEYSADPLPVLASASTQDVARYRETMTRLNCTFEKIRILPQNIGYLKLNSFPDPSVCESTARAAMHSLNRTDAIIFDLRDNRGGEPAMVALIASYLFDHPEYWYNPREATTAKSWIQSTIPGNRLADKPVYVLTSARTYSGAEQFSYDLKMLKRATIVGETTGGAAHAGVWHRLDDHFGMGIPEVRAINPFADNDWAEIGVAPDIHVNAADALRTAEQLARSRLHQR